MNQIEEILKQLVQIKSYSGQEKELADFIMAFCQKNNLPVENQDGNIIIKYLTHSQKCLIFNAHLDTVKEGNISTWTYPPFGKKAGVIKSGKLYGLGASDDKAGITSFLSLALLLKNKKLAIDIFLIYVTKEEIDGSGSKSFVSFFSKKYLSSYKKVAAIIGEPTNLKKVEIGNRGNYFLKITTYGDSGHGSQPALIKKHAIEEMIQVIAQIKIISNKLAVKYKDPILGSPTFSLTGIQTPKSSLNKVPDTCYSIWDIRTTPKLHYKLIKVIKEKLKNKVNIELMVNPVSFVLTSPKEKIVTILKKIIPSLGITISPGSNDVYFFNKAGIPAVVFGPGNKEVIHKENEYVELTNIYKSIEIYSQIINDF